jgi:signal transduction histidine kinase
LIDYSQLVKSHAVIDRESNIAGGRIVLSLAQLGSIFIDPTIPHLASWMSVTTGAFAIDRHVLQILCAHLAYAIAVYAACRRHVGTAYIVAVSTGLDLVFAVMVALFTEGPTTPSFVFFAFAIVAAGCRMDFSATVAVTLASTLLYLAMIAWLTPGDWHRYVMRPAALAIMGYLIGFLGRQRVGFEERVRELETAAERQSIARFLHDGYAQGLAGVNLRLETCRKLLQGGRAPEALEEVIELQAGVAREFDDVRAYIRSLAEVVEIPAREATPSAIVTLFHLRAVLTAPGPVLEPVLQIVLEGMRNTRRHGSARAATIDVAEDVRTVRIAIDDDGVGFQGEATPPWSIASRVAECGGRLRIASDGRPGAHLEIELPLHSSHDDTDSYRPRG